MRCQYSSLLYDMYLFQITRNVAYDECLSTNRLFFCKPALARDKRAAHVVAEVIQRHGEPHIVAADLVQDGNPAKMLRAATAFLAGTGFDESGRGLISRFPTRAPFLPSCAAGLSPLPRAPRWFLLSGESDAALARGLQHPL